MKGKRFFWMALLVLLLAAAVPVQADTYANAAPVLSSVVNAPTGVRVKWEKVTGAENYRVFRKTSGGSWKGVGNTTGTSFTDTTAVSGKTYFYTVRCINSEGTDYTSSYDKTGLQIRYIAAPVLLGVSNISSGVKVQWNPVTGAEKYRVYRKTSGDSVWKKVGVTTGTAFTDTTAVSGTTYTYTVRCTNAAGTAFTSSFDSTGKTILRLCVPALSGVANVTAGVRIQWSEVTGAVKYRVFRKVSGGSTWKRLGDTTAVRFTDTTAVSGKTYLYTVRCINAAGTAYTSSFDSAGLSIRCLSCGTISGLSNTASGVKVTWGAVTGASGYYIYRKTGSGSYSRIAAVSGSSTVSYTDTAVKSKNATAYTYAVRAYYGSTKGYYAAKTIVRLSTPTLTGVSNSSSAQMTVSWTKVSGVAGYQIRYSTSSSFSSYDSVTVTGASSTEKVITGLTKGKTYYVLIRTYYSASGTKYYSGWSGSKSVEIGKSLSTLLTQVKGLLPTGNGSWSFYVCNLASGEDGAVNNGSMQAASLIKLYIMGAVYENYSSLCSRYGTSAVDSYLNAMITVSDNSAANTLVSYLGSGSSSAGMSVVNAFCRNHGYTDTSMGRLLLASSANGDNYTSVRDCGNFLKEIYQINAGTAVGATLFHADKMYALLKQQTRRNKIPAQMPSGVGVANKTGELSTVENDAGIVYNTAKGVDLVIVFMSENLTAVGSAQTEIAADSRYIYAYYNE